MVVQVTPPGIANLGWKFWIIWAVICASFIPTTYFFYPETANRTLEDIDRFFEGNPGIFIHKNKIATQLHRPEEYVEADARIAEKEKLDDYEGLEKGREVGDRGMEETAIATTT